MIFTECRVQGAYLIDIEPRVDERGFFARAWCEMEFAARGLRSKVAQINISHNERRGALRGMHYQQPPFAEAKVVSAMRGAIYDVVLDLRPESRTYRQWDAVELTEANHRMLYVPEGCAHGFQTLADDTDVLYFMSELHAPGQGRGCRFDDPQFEIRWPLPVMSISDADRSWAPFVA